MKLNNIIKENIDFFTGEILKFFSPGRVNLIGEHIDYHGGQVFPIAINLGTYGVVSLRNDTELHMISLNFIDKGTTITDISDLRYKPEDGWTNYLKGITLELINRGYRIDKGLDILIIGDLPNEAGLSSSASLEMLMGTILNQVFDLNIPVMELVKVSQKVENEYIGVNCGIMDQFAVAMGKKNYALSLNSMTLEYSYVPLNLGEYSLIITNTNMKRSLSESKYNQRIVECDSGLNTLKQNGKDISYLCELRNNDLPLVKKLITDKIISNRVEHVISENERSLSAVKALKNKDLKYFGKLMIDSHDSLANKYEVSTIELDTLVDLYLNYEAIGARMTGAGFGGCTISLAPTENIDSIIANVKKDYHNKFGIDASFYVVETSSGARKIE